VDRLYSFQAALAKNALLKCTCLENKPDSQEGQGFYDLDVPPQ